MSLPVMKILILDMKKLKLNIWEYFNDIKAKIWAFQVQDDQNPHFGILM